VIPAILVRGVESWIGYALIVLLLAYAVAFWLTPSRAKNMAAVASHLRLHFEPIMSRAQLGILGTTFDVGYPGENCMTGVIAGRETMIFDKTMLVEPLSRPGGEKTASEQTIVGFKVSGDTPCRNRSILRPGDWHVEKMDEWVFVYGRDGLVKPRDIPAYIEEAREWFENATDAKGHGPSG